MFYSTCPQYTRFRLSGINLGVYDFAVNPTQYSPYPPRSSKTYHTIMDFDPTVDEDYNKVQLNMQWQMMPEQMWIDLEPYARSNVDGRSEELYFWDGDSGRFNGTRISINDFRARAKGGYSPVDRFDVTLTFRQII